VKIVEKMQNLAKYFEALKLKSWGSVKSVDKLQHEVAEKSIEYLVWEGAKFQQNEIVILGS
jgi:hypothetical protein